MKTPTAADLPMIAQIASGLLASGHYTRGETDSDNLPGLVFSDFGEDWKLNGMPSRFQAVVVEDAVKIWQDLHAEVEIQC